MHTKYEVSTSNGSKVIANVKVDNRQTDRQTNRQDKNNMPPIIRSGGIKSSWEKTSYTACKVHYDNPMKFGFKYLNATVAYLGHI